jgi:hypothetical protein
MPSLYHFKRLTYIPQITLQIIGVAGENIFSPILSVFSSLFTGFGRAVTSNDDITPPPGHQMTFKEALQRVSEDTMIKVIAGDWMPNFTERIQKIRIAFVELEVWSFKYNYCMHSIDGYVRYLQKYMTELIEDRRQTGVKGQDLFSGLLAASEEENGALSDSDLMGNIFVFMIAGHEASLLYHSPHLTFIRHFHRQQLILCAIPSSSWLYILMNRKGSISISRACTPLTGFQ